MRYIHEFKEGSALTVEEEVKYLESFIALNALRFGNVLSFKKSITATDKKIEPLLLLPFIENAYKHGELSKEKTIDIELNCNDNYLEFNIENNISNKNRKDSVGGIGVKNIERRLELLYDGKASLHTNTSNNIFTAKLLIHWQQK